jgi:hypothetical protein
MDMTELPQLFDKPGPEGMMLDLGSRTGAIGTLL